MKINAAALTDSEVMLKLNKRDNRAVWAFEIKGHVRRRSPSAADD